MGTEKDCLFEAAARLMVNKQKCRTSTLSITYSIGYNRVARIIDQLEKAGIVGPSNGVICRDVLVKDEAELETIFEKLRSHE